MWGLVGLAAAAVLAAGGSAAAAEATAEQREAFGAAVENAIVAQRVLLNCTALESRGAELLGKSLRKSITETIPLLTSAGYSAEEVLAFVDRFDDANLMMLDRPFGEVIRFCRANEDVVQRMMRFEVPQIEREAERIFSAGSGERDRPRDRSRDRDRNRP